MYRYQKIIIRKPFVCENIPFLAKAYKNAFSSGSSYPLSPLRKISNRLIFYILLNIPFLTWKGTFSIQDNKNKFISFNAKNRQYNILYFYKYETAYEPETSALIDMFLPNQGILYDIGSNWGYFSLYAASRNDFSGEIHSFEMNPSSFDDLVSVVKKTTYKNIIHCYNYALSNQQGKKGIKQYSHSGLTRLSESEFDTTVDTVCLDQLTLPKPDIIKMDVEGHEVQVLEGGSRLLEEAKPLLVFENTISRGDLKFPLQSLSFLYERGYRIFLPLWIDQIGDFEIFFNDDNQYLTPSKYENLVLYPLNIKTRYLYPERMNLFACHSDRLYLLENPTIGECIKNCK